MGIQGPIFKVLADTFVWLATAMIPRHYRRTFVVSVSSSAVAGEQLLWPDCCSWVTFAEVHRDRRVPLFSVCVVAVYRRCRPLNRSMNGTVCDRVMDAYYGWHAMAVPLAEGFLWFRERALRRPSHRCWRQLVCLAYWLLFCQWWLLWHRNCWSHLGQALRVRLRQLRFRQLVDQSYSWWRWWKKTSWFGGACGWLLLPQILAGNHTPQFFIFLLWYLRQH